MTTVTTRDIHDIVTKLSSDKAKVREEGIKLLNTWLKGERSISFCKYLSRKTAMLKLEDIAGVETWPFLVRLLIFCTKEEISGSKKRDPKLLFAKTLRTVVQFAQDNKSHGHHLPLIMITKDLFTHILDVFRGVPSFHSEYAVLLRHVLTVRDYRFHMKKAHYCELVVIHIEKVKVSLSEEHSGKSRYCAEECFKHLMTLHFLLENPPGDFPSKIRKTLVEFFTDFKLTTRDVWRIPRKFIECLNAYLLKDGPNLGGESLIIHNSVKTFVFSNWHQRPDSDTDLKDVLILYAKLQLLLRRGNEDENEPPLLDELLKIIGKDLEHCSILCIGTSRLDKFTTAGAKDEKIGTLASSNHNLLELAALVVYRSIVGVNKRPLATKRARNLSTADYLLNQLQHGTWVWHAVLCYLCCNYKNRLPKDHFVCWFDGICSSFERILADANKGHNYDGLLWTLRSLHQLFSLLPPPVSAEKCSPKSLSASHKLVRGWQAVWKSLIHGLPFFSNVALVADAAFMLLGDMVAHGILVMTEVPRDVWDLQCFRDISSLSALYFISCYFSRKGSQGDLRDNLHLRQSILRRVISIITRKATLKLDEHMVVLLPAAVYAICVGASDILNYYRGLYPAYWSVDTSGMTMDWLEGNEQRHEDSDENLECLISVVAEINTEFSDKEPSTRTSQGVRLPRQLQDPLLSEMESCVLHELMGRKNERNQLHDIFLHCSLLSSLFYGSMIMRKNDDLLPFRTELCNCLVGMIESAILVIQDSMRDSKSCGFWSSSLSSDGACSAVASLKNFLSCPILYGHGMHDTIDPILTPTILSVERLLMALSRLYLQLHEYWKNVQFETTMSEVSGSSTPADNILQPGSSNSRLLDMELDSADDSPDVVCGTTTAGMSFGWSRRKMDTISLISCGFSVLPIVTWDILFDILNTESDPKVCEYILQRLCQNFHCLSARKLTNLVAVIDDMIEQKSSQNLDLFDVLSPLSCLLAKMLSLNHGGKDKDIGLPLEDKNFAQSLMHFGDLVIKVFESNLLDRRGRQKLVDCICDFIGLNPQIGQTMIQKLLILLSDPDYRVRLLLARRVGILFLSWDGHDVLFQDICSNFDPRLEFCPKGRLVTKIKDPGAYSQLVPAIETIVVTLMHVAFHSEKIELEAVFRICMVSTHHPCQRDLVKAALDNLARQLQYSCRSKYLEELMGPLIFSWVACGMGLQGLVQIMDLFVLDIEQSHFLQYCCQWLVPALILHGDTHDSSTLQWLAEQTGQTVPALVISYFPSVFSICMVLHCCNNSESQKASAVLQSKVLQFAVISEDDRDMLIKKNMVTIVCQIISLASSTPDTQIPFFPREHIELAVRTVVDGFLDLDNYNSSEGVIDKINIFRPDRVFMILIELHYKVTAAVNQRHVAHHLAGVEVLIRILGHRVAVASTYCYLLNLVGQFISIPSLQDQCCRMISLLLKMCKSNMSEEITRVLGEQLQYLVSKLVSCCIPSGSNAEISSPSSSQVLSLLHLLIVDSDPSLHAYIKEIEPFPDLEEFHTIKTFHGELCRGYSPRDYFLKFVKRSLDLPPKLLLWSLQAFHRKLLDRESFLSAEDVESNALSSDWYSDGETVQAVWSLVRLCCLPDAEKVRALVSDLVSKVGIGDPRSVVFHLPGNLLHMSGLRAAHNSDLSRINFEFDAVASDELLVALIRKLKNYLMDDSVKIVDLSSQTLRGILSTERGIRVLGLFDSYERSLIGVHGKGVNLQLVESILLNLQKKFAAEGKSLEDSSLWSTCDKTFDLWICPLVYSLTHYCTDITLRLCQDIVMVKAEIAELLLPSIMINIAGRKDLSIDLCKHISVKVEQHILTERNKLTKSIQVMLDALNELRLCHILESDGRAFSSPQPENLKASRSSSGSRIKHRASPKSHESDPAKSAATISTRLWDKVYWLIIDYLTVAKSALLSGSYFTALMYVEYWCEEHFNSLTLGKPDFSPVETLAYHTEILLSALTQINEPDSLYGIIQSHKLTSQTLTFEHEGNWSKALEYHDLHVRLEKEDNPQKYLSHESSGQTSGLSFPKAELEMQQRKPYKGVIKSLQRIGCAHILDLYCQGLISRQGEFQDDLEFVELQYEAAWRAGNWDFSLFNIRNDSVTSNELLRFNPFNQNLHSCLRALQEGDSNEFDEQLMDSKQELMLSLSHASEERTEYIYSTIVKLQILDHLSLAWDLRWGVSPGGANSRGKKPNVCSEPTVPTMDQLFRLDTQWGCILKQTKMDMNLLEPFVAFRKVLVEILGCKDSLLQHLLQSSSVLRKGAMFSQAAASLQEFKVMCMELGGEHTNLYWLGRLEEAKLLRAQGQKQMAINLGKYIAELNQSNEESSDVHRLVGKWLAETRSSNSRTILEKYLKRAVSLADEHKAVSGKYLERKCRTHFHLAHYADALFKTHDERLNSNEWEAAMRLRKHKKLELEALIKRFKSSAKGEKTDYSLKIQELQKQLSMDAEEAQKLQDDRDIFLNLALVGYKHCLVTGDKYDVRVVFRLVSLWFELSSMQNVITAMANTVKEVPSYKFIPLVYQIASRMGTSKEVQGPNTFQSALASLLKKMAIDHPYHTILQLLALSNGDRIKDKQRSKNSYVVDLDKKHAAENLLDELLSHHGNIIRQMKQMVEIYIKLAELETRREDTNKKISLPRDIRSVRELELVPVLTSNLPVDCSGLYHEGTFPHFKGLADSVVVMNGINAPKVVQCYGSDGKTYRQLAKSGNDDLRQDAVMEQFFGLVNTFLHNNRDTWRRKLGVRTYKVVPFTPSAGIIEWVDGTLPLGEYLIGSSRNGGAHGRYGAGDWSFAKCREHMMNAKDKRKAFRDVYKNFRPVMHYFFLERFLQPADWFEKRLAYARSVAASSMVGYIVGLGDRHSMNILIDQATAEVVHIDLGVAFDQGLMLKTPERVPFRLTRDIIDGMGVTGVEGVFRRCCEETLDLMRINKEALLTIIEVFIHDPLYKWALSPLKALQRQKEGDDDIETNWEDSLDEYEGNKDAARALMRVKQKLDGYEDGELRSVHGQVQQLIQDAIDPERLCNMFPGWGAWM
ncbi:serine/threonine-protein kinase ATM [Silene latifolia]|uniref:serine/threonine-protein kinase ATM n=1 Tax=Silene latifolia TaxID=37657 RepID=UPI003D77E5B6